MRNLSDDALGQALLDLVCAAVTIGQEEQRTEPVVRLLIDTAYVS